VRPANLALALLVFLIGGRAMNAIPAPSDEAVTVVTLDVFSGRPNPTWTLTEAQSRELQSRIAGLKTPLSSAPVLPDDLGYRGLHVTTRGPSKVVELTIGSGGIVLKDGDSVSYFQDPNRQLEQWLVHTGQERIAPDLLRIIDGEIAARR
jgi:hypothetical protein